MRIYDSAGVMKVDPLQPAVAGDEEWEETLSGSGLTRSLTYLPKNIASNRDAMLIAANGIVQYQVAPGAESNNTFSRSGTTLTWAYDPGIVVAWYERA
jgi:hypothetical protein